MALVDSSAAFTRPYYADSDRRQLLEMVPPGVQRLLDVGCNRGGFGAALKESAPDMEVWGIEPDTESAAIAARRLDNVIVNYFAQDAALPDGYFDLITFNDSLEHMPDPLAALSLARRKLRPGGRIHACVPNMRHIECLEHLLLDKNWAYEENGVRDRTHLRFFTQRSIVELVQRCGYTVLESRFVGENWWEADKRLRRALFRLFPRIMAEMKYKQILVIAQLPEESEISA